MIARARYDFSRLFERTKPNAFRDRQRVESKRAGGGEGGGAKRAAIARPPSGWKEDARILRRVEDVRRWRVSRCRREDGLRAPRPNQAPLSSTGEVPLTSLSLSRFSDGRRSTPQAVASSGAGSSHAYTGVLQSAKKIYAEEGVLAFWKGNGTNVVRVFPYSACQLMANDLVRERERERERKAGRIDETLSTTLSTLGRL